MPVGRTLQIIILAKDQASAVLKNVSSQFGTFHQQAQAAILPLTAVSAGLTALVGKMTLTAARTEEMGVVIDNMGRVAGKSEEELAATEESIKDLGITTQAAREIMARFMGANLDLADASRIARAAQDLAVIGMKDSSQAAADLTYAIASMQPRILRQYGLFINLNDVYEQTAEALGKDVQELTEAEKRQGMLNAVLDQSANYAGTYEAAMGTAGKQLRSFSRYTEEIANQFGQYFLPMFSEGIKAATDFAKGIRGLDEDTTKGIAGLLGYATASSAALTAVAALTIALPKLAAAFTFATGPVGLITIALTSLVVGIIATRAELGKLSSELMETAGSATEYAEKMQEGREAMLGGVYGARAFGGAVGEQAKEIMKAEDEMTWMIAKAEDLDMALRQEQDEMIAAASATYKFSDAVREAAEVSMKDLAVAIAGGVLDLHEMVDEYRELSNTVSSAWVDVTDIEQSARDDIERMQADLNEKLVALDIAKEEKLAWVRAGAHARTIEENAEAIAYWEAHYEEEKQKLIDAVNEKIGVREGERDASITAAETEASERARIQDEARQEELAKLKEAAQERILIFALEMLEHQGQLKGLVSSWGDVEMSAQEAYDLIKAGVLPVNEALAQNIGAALSAIEGNWTEMGQTANTQMADLESRAGEVFETITQAQQEVTPAVQDTHYEYTTLEDAIADMASTHQAEQSDMLNELNELDGAIMDSQNQYVELDGQIVQLGTTHSVESTNMIGGERLLQAAVRTTKQTYLELKDVVERVSRFVIAASEERRGAIRREIEAVHNLIQAYRHLAEVEGAAGATTSAQGGLMWVPQTMGVTVHKGEAILTAHQARERRRGAGGKNVTINAVLGDMYGVDGLEAALEDMIAESARYVE